ncbi:hypothetical protein D3H55_16825 [Bacillus salacetis]|uniref:Uncharacterized protein n=1 Tax=Bacillus salacetis TaxID=2315464 RepID=A0A3A1QT44_9BACI|nr:hypothetical protein [Bacillus salacetis]RIW30398.1 hypothetical protein D3H55_16825 [Bacillus salacetis]
MKNNTFAIFNGKEYSAGIKADGRIILRSQDPKDELNGFIEKSFNNKKIYVKYVSRNGIQEMYHKTIKAHYKGYVFEVVYQKDNIISIVTIVGDYKKWENIGMSTIDKGIYQKWVKKDDVLIDIDKEKIL